jgi:hypothetical protein
VRGVRTKQKNAAKNARKKNNFGEGLTITMQ